MAYHFSTTRPEMHAVASLPPPGRSRLSPPPNRTGHAAARPGLVEFLRQLGHETLAPVQGRKLRCGLVATPWQLQQSLSLLSAERPDDLPQLSQGVAAQAVALVLDTSLSQPCCGALGTWWLRRDGLASLQQHEHFARAAESLQRAGQQFADIEAQALCRQSADTPGLLQALLTAVLPTLHDWGVTHLTVSCAHANALRFRSELGFEPVKTQIHGERILLHRALGDLYATALSSLDAADSPVALRA